MPDPVDHLEAVGDIVEQLRDLGLEPVLEEAWLIDAPASAYFFSAATGLRVDLLFDFPIPAAKLAEHATRTKIRSHDFHIASEQDLLRLKRIAKQGRSAPGDAEDIAFLEARRRRRSVP